MVADANDESMGASSCDRNKAGCEDGTGRNADIENGDTSTSTIAIYVSSRSTNVIDTAVVNEDDVEYSILLSSSYLLLMMDPSSSPFPVFVIDAILWLCVAIILNLYFMLLYKFR